MKARFVVAGIGTALFVAGVGWHAVAYAEKDQLLREQAGTRLVTIFDRGEKQVAITDAKTIKEALGRASIELDPRDTVEPSLDEELVAPEYYVNIYRARPVLVVDGPTRVQVMTSHQTASHIAKDAEITLYPEDVTALTRTDTLVADGAGLQLTINRAVPFTLDLYGDRNEVRTQAHTVGEMLKEKKITLGSAGRVSMPLEAPITQGAQVRVWREGRQTVTVKQPIGYSEMFIYDADRPVNYRAVTTMGEPGVDSVTYEIEIKDGKEVAKKEIARIVTKAPKRQVVSIGIKGLGMGISKNRGAYFSTDSKGVVHRETYYDLDMGVVMRACGQSGAYSVRFDGVKIDAAGYVIIAAHLGRYPRCSIVETSVGLGKVYDTGGFVQRHPDGFDIATDWTNNNGR